MTYDVAVRLVRTLLQRFFRRIEVSGLDHVPAEGGGLVVSWHPNGIIDPALILGQFPRQIVFGARHGLLKVPVFGQILRAIGTVPIYRAQDKGGGTDEERRARNRVSLDALATKIATGSFSALFPEGVSHDDSHLQELKVGAARLFYRAGQLGDENAIPPVIIPVGLHYDEKDVFHSNVLVSFHRPLELPPELALLPADAPDEEFRARCTALTEAIEGALIATCHPTEDWEQHHLMHRTRSLVRAERSLRAGQKPGAPDMLERTLGFERVWKGYYASRERAPEQTAALMERIAEYDADLVTLGLQDHQLDATPRKASPWWGLRLATQVVGLYVLLPPLLVVGLIVNGPPYFFLKWFAQRIAKKRKDLASIKFLSGLVVYPSVWLGVGALAWLGWINVSGSFPAAVAASPLAAAALTLLLAALGGVSALRYTEQTRSTLRAIRVRFTRARYRESIQRLRSERAALHDAIEAMAEGLELPGRVGADGRVEPGPEA
ncbi:MAG: 1-acyl-sn-glycerol-3-phosphate acyltransferase [Planctomycetes bacterium]|nr:1-acyl-sn-glycerol-3-phosphate acyltransferase [Planctomycetota bacterium]